MITNFIVMFVAVALILGLVILRGKSDGKFDVKLTDAAIAGIFVVLWLLLSGQISKLVVGSEGVTVETTRQAILDASAQKYPNRSISFRSGRSIKPGEMLMRPSLVSSRTARKPCSSCSVRRTTTHPPSSKSLRSSPSMYSLSM